MTLVGKRVLITGGGSGVGADLARGFSKAGTEVVIAGRHLEALQKVAARWPGVRSIVADVTNEASVSNLFAEAGVCDIVIANAGAADSAAFTRTSLEQWNAMIAVNLTGVFLTFRDGLKQFSGWGRLISIASTAGLRGYPYVAPYAAAKHGVIGLTKSVAMEVVKKPITANAICPGYLETEMTERTLANIVKKTGRTVAEARAVLVTSNPQSRLIAPSEVTSAALWLCAAGSEGINGQTIVINGGEF